MSRAKTARGLRIEAFLFGLGAANYSPYTLVQYRNELAEFCLWLAKG